MNNAKFRPPPEDKAKDHKVCFRLPAENVKLLMEINPNISHTLRYIVELYLHEYANREERFEQWNRKA
jgi:hypothetical protein